MAQQVINLTFHGIGEPPEHVDEVDREFWLSPDFFYWVLDRVSERNDTRITFDDGNLSDYEYGFPALIDRGLEADFFVCAGRIDQPGYLSKSQIQEMKNARMRIGSHGYHHQSWRGLSDEHLEVEIDVAKQIIEEVVDSRIVTASCPVGDYNSKVLQKLRVAGFKHVFTSDKGRTRSDDWLQSRNSLRRSNTRDEFEKIMDLQFGSILGMHRRIKTFLKRWR